jgi:hypothetical protein
MLPRTDEFGDITRWEQHLKGDFANPPTFDPEEIGSIIINKSSGRDKTGISEALRSQEEIETFRANQQAMREATERIGYPFVHAKAGREGATQLNDNELRRIRNRLADIGPGETQVTGPDVDIDLKEPATVDFGEIQERDMRMLATSLGVPVELLNHGSDGLGSGMPAELRKDLLALQNEADRRRFSEQFVDDILRPIVRDYSPFDHTQDMEVVFDPFLDDKTDMASLIQSVGDYLRADEVRDMLGRSEIEDEEIGQGFQTPAEQEKPEEEQGGGLFGSSPSDTDFRSLQQRGNPISDPSECNGTVIEGPQGGLRCIPDGEAGGEETQEAQQEIRDIVESDLEGEELKNELEESVSEITGAETVDMQNFSDEQAAKTSEALAALGAAGETEGITKISTDVSEEMSERRAMANYDPFSQSITFDPDSFTEENAARWNGEGFLAGDSIQHLVAHEVGHHQHFQSEVDGQSAGMQAQAQEIPEEAKPEFAEQVSVYAVENPNEMVAELYAMQVQGEELSTGMENAYEEFNGPDIAV